WFKLANHVKMIDSSTLSLFSFQRAFFVERFSSYHVRHLRVKTFLLKLVFFSRVLSSFLATRNNLSHSKIEYKSFFARFSKKLNGLWKPEAISPIFSRLKLIAPYIRRQ
ncbi:hypothetical protein, partial [Brevibacillus sp. SAFN-007a]|uniref:hypothetical protein n=1 Tax=Brevibacillus sp. SAFN-007a TaxID=3436862 RepID=UPI003F7E94C2